MMREIAKNILHESMLRSKFMVITTVPKEHFFSEKGSKLLADGFKDILLY